MKKLLKNMLERSGYKIFKNELVPKPHDLLFYINKFSQITNVDLIIETIFDVGANEGQTTKLFAEFFPEASIFAFEPVSETFKVLEENVKGLNARCFNF